MSGASSCIAHPAVRTRSKDSAVVFPLASRLGSWADVLSDSEDEDMPLSLLQGITIFGCVDEVSSTVKVGESVVASKESVQTSSERRTPLNGLAPKFVPSSPLSSRAPAFAPRLAQTAGESPVSPALGIPQQSLTKSQAKTTAMLRNLPCSYTRGELIRDLDRKGFAGGYDFVYVPMDFERELCKGFGFVNFTTEEQLREFIKEFEGRQLHASSPKVCAVTMSRAQGLRANILRFRNSPVMDSEVPDASSRLSSRAGAWCPSPSRQGASPHSGHARRAERVPPASLGPGRPPRRPREHRGRPACPTAGARAKTHPACLQGALDCLGVDGSAM
ncbi:unnamed protein product, partial [Prorocentrum cordatum]